MFWEETGRGGKNLFLEALQYHEVCKEMGRICMLGKIDRDRVKFCSVKIRCLKFARKV